jgi:hypothetical protein
VVDRPVEYGIDIVNTHEDARTGRRSGRHGSNRTLCASVSHESKSSLLARMLTAEQVCDQLGGLVNPAGHGGNPRQ